MAKASVEVATLTAQGQVTVPKATRAALGLRQGDQLSWEVEDDCVRVRAIAPLDMASLQSLDATLGEWSSPTPWCGFRSRSAIAKPGSGGPLWCVRRLGFNRPPVTWC